jgi:hypothetical protein
MRLALVIACVLIVGMYAPDTGVRQQFKHAPAQAQAAPPQRQAQTELDRQVTLRSYIRRGNTPVAAESAVARGRTEWLRPSGAATDAQPQPGNRQLPGPVGLLLALALLNGAGAAPPAISQPEIN